MEPVAVGQIGLGEWGTKIGEAISYVPTMKLVACYDIDTSRAHSFAQKFGGRPVSNLESLLDIEPLEAVLIATPNPLHFSQACAAARKGKHIFVEKPMATTLTDAESLINLCQKSNVILAVGHNVRYYGLFRRVKEFIESGDLGEIVLLEANRSMPRGFLLKPGEWRWYQENLPGGVLSQLGIHMIDTFQYLIGPIRRVYAMASDKHLSADIVDTVVLTLEFEGGALGYVGSSYVIADSFCLKVHGTKGSVLADVNSGLFMKKLDSVNWVPLEFERVNAEVEELKEFATCIRLNTPPPVSGEAGMKALRVALEALKSASEDRSKFL